MDSTELAERVAKTPPLRGMDPERLGFSLFVIAKATRFIEQGRVSQVTDFPEDPCLWRVHGDTGTYVVRYDRRFPETGRIGFLVCSCPLSEHHNGMIAYCSHALAVLTMAAPQTGDPR